MIIKSTQNEQYKYLLRLATQRAFRRESNSFLAFGNKIIQELKEYLKPKKVITSPDYPEAGESIFAISLIKNISGQTTPEGIFAEFPFPPLKDLNAPLLVLDGIQDPGNMGTLLRTALAFGWGGAIFLPGCVDPFSPKVIQSSRGAIVHLPFKFMSNEELSSFLKEKSLPLFIADCIGKSLDSISKNNTCALLLGNEGQGVRGKFEGTRITIPIHSCCESLNVAIAGSIIMHYLKPL